MLQVDHDSLNSGASPTIYAFSGAVIVISTALVAVVFVGLTARLRPRPTRAGRL